MEHTIVGILQTTDIKLKATKLFVLHAVSYNRDIREHKFPSHSCASWMTGWTELSAEMVNMKFTHSAVQILAARLMADRLAGWPAGGMIGSTLVLQAGVMRKGVVFGHEGKLYSGGVRDE
jgi:hypothetical protein